jgi:pyruvate formate lyase activating enzyme
MKTIKLQKLILTDFPEKIACRIRLSILEGDDNYSKLSFREFFSFLKKKKNLLDGVVITEEKTELSEDSPEFLGKIKKLGYKIKFETTGFSPEALENLINEKLVDYVALDIKAPKEKYPKALGCENCSLNYLLSKIEKSINLLKEGRVDYEFSTTLEEEILQKDDIVKIANWLKPGKKYVLRNAGFKKPAGFFTDLRERISPFFDSVEIKEI